MALSTAALGQQVETRNLDDIVADALDLLADRLPEWTPRNGSLEVIYLEAVAQAAAEVAAAANAQVGAVVEAVLSTLHGVPRLPGAQAVGSLALTFDSTVTTVVPTGTGFLLPDTGIELVSTSDVTVTAATSCTVPVRTATATSAANGLGPGTAVDVLDAIPNALTVAVAVALTGGTDPESDSAYLARASSRLARVTSSLVVTDHFAAWTLEEGRASNATAIAAWNGAAIGTAGSDAGHVTVVAYGRGGALSAGDKTALAVAMQALTAVGATVHVVDPALTSQNVVATVKAKPGWVAADVQAACVAALRAWLNPETWPFGDDVRATQVPVVLAAAAGVDYVVSVTTPAADVAIGVNGLAAAGTLTVTAT